jgi:hypothetical protein
VSTTVVSPRERLRLAQARIQERSTWAAVGLLALLSLLALVLIVRKGQGTTFYYDEWNFVMNRRDWDVDTFLRPHAEHFSLVPVLIFKVLFATVGLDSYWVYRLFLIVVHLAVVGLLFEYARRRVGNWPGLAAATLVLFLGAAWHDLLVAFQVSFVLSVAAGLGALLALERKDALGDGLACALVALGLASSSVGISFAAAVLVETVLGPDRRQRLWIALAPLALYGLWSVEYGNPTHTSGGRTLDELIRLNAPAVPGYMATSIAGAVGALIGIGVDWGRPLALIGLALLGYRLVRGPASPRLYALLAAGAAFWGLTALFRAQLNAPLDSRYLYLGAILVLLIAVQLLRPVAMTPRLAAVVGVLVAAAALANFGSLRSGSVFLQDGSRYLQVELAALELAGPSIEPSFVPDPVRAPDITAGKYFEAVEQYGSPAASPDEIPARAEPERAAADDVLLRALGPTIGPRREHGDGPRPAVEAASGEVSNTASCAALGTSSGGSLEVRVPPEGLTVSGSLPVEVRLRSFAGAFPAGTRATVPAEATYALRIAPRAGVTWHVRLNGGGAIRACGLAD